MTDSSPTINQIKQATNFEELVTIPFQGDVNAICWKRKLEGDFAEIVQKIKSDENIVSVDEEQLLDFDLSEEGKLARAIILEDLKLLKAQGAAPTLNVIKYYDRDDTFFSTDVYSFHVDRSPIPTNTFLCTYYGESSEIVANAQAQQKIFIPKLREQLKKEFAGSDQEFESYLTEHFFDLHYQANANANIISLGLGNLWRLAVDHPQSSVLPCLHRAPIEKPGQSRLLLIC